jgi:hypothetical protein
MARKIQLLSKFSSFIETFMMTREECYENTKSVDGKCYGVVGGTKNTDYLSEYCIDCPYCTMIVK